MGGWGGRWAGGRSGGRGGGRGGAGRGGREGGGSLPEPHHPTAVLKASTRCVHVQQLPILSPSAHVVPLVANTDANSLEVKPEVSASKYLECPRAENPR